MKKTKERNGHKTFEEERLPAEQGRGNPDTRREIRQQITNLERNDAVGMVEITMEEVGKGHYLGMKYLFEMIGPIRRRLRTQ